VLPDGTRVRKGARVSYMIYAMGRHGAASGAKDALEFRPERWLTPQGTLRLESPFKFVAFNAGPRTCLGRDMAYIQMKSVASCILRQYRLAVVPGQSGEYALCHHNAHEAWPQGDCAPPGTEGWGMPLR